MISNSQIQQISFLFSKFLYPPKKNYDLEELGNKIGVAVARSVSTLNPDQIQEFISGFIHGVNLNLENTKEKQIKEKEFNIDLVYQKYYNAWMMTTNDPLPKSDFIARVIEDKDFAKIWGAIPPDSQSGSIRERNDD